MNPTGASRAQAFQARRSTSASLSAMRLATLVFLAGFVLHNADHFRRGIDVLTPQVFWAGTASGVISLAAMAFVMLASQQRLAPMVAAFVGLSMAMGVSAVHLLPTWSALSDSLPDGRVDGLTWIAVLCEIAGAVVFSWAGFRARETDEPEG